jgi:hypothetical protein
VFGEDSKLERIYKEFVFSDVPEKVVQQLFPLQNKFFVHIALVIDQ